MSKSVVVVPCYNEEARLQPGGFEELLLHDRTRILFVDDGSTDGTHAALSRLCRGLRFASVLRLDRNQGKAEAVRRGLLQALDDGASLVGYLDADLATPPSEMLRVMETLRNSTAQVALGCRLDLRGTRIHRKPGRRWLGRAFSLAASAVLGARFQDTQCGAKGFRATGALRQALDERFHARWAFDVEMLGRLLTGSPTAAALRQNDFLEVPLRSWREVPGSKLRSVDIPLLGVELARIAWALSRLRGAARPPQTAVPLPPSQALEEDAPSRVARAG